MCDCKSYNAQIGTFEEVTLQRPWWLDDTLERPKGICVDACITTAIEALWARGIVTMASCCGHGGKVGLGIPTVVLGDNQDVDLARRALAEIDERRWALQQWRLVDVTETR